MLNKMEAFILDVDGVMTTGQFLYNEDGKAFKIFGPDDSDGLNLISDHINIHFVSADKKGFKISFITLWEKYPLLEGIGTLFFKSSISIS